MVRRILVGPEVSRVSSLGPSVLSGWRIIICGTPDDAPSDCAASGSLLLSVANSGYQMGNFNRDRGFLLTYFSF